MGGFNVITVVLSLFFLTGCVSLPRSFHALRYQDQKVYIDQRHYYQVGPLSGNWQKSSNNNPGIIFKNRKTKGTIATEALCGAAFEDLSLKILTHHLFAGLENIKKIKEEEWPVSQRKGLYTEAEASLDGVPVLLNLFVIKKNRCHFDFLGVAPPQEEGITEDFASFVKGFDYQ